MLFNDAFEWWDYTASVGDKILSTGGPGEVTLTGEKWNTRQRTRCTATLSTTDTKYTHWDRNQAPTVRGKQRTSWVLPRPPNVIRNVRFNNLNAGNKKVICSLHTEITYLDSLLYFTLRYLLRWALMGFNEEWRPSNKHATTLTQTKATSERKHGRDIVSRRMKPPSQLNY